MLKRMTTGGVALVLATALVATAGASPDWSIKGDQAGACSCDIPCPCSFGSMPSKGHCEANVLIEIEEGHYGDVSLDGIAVVMTLRVGEWVKFYVDEEATDGQADAVQKLLIASHEAIQEAKVLSSEKAPISVERGENKIKFSTSSSTVEIEMMEGKDGKPIKIENLPSPYETDFTQYKAITNSHKSKDKEFSYAGQNGSTSKIEGSSKEESEK